MLSAFPLFFSLDQKATTFTSMQGGFARPIHQALSLRSLKGRNHPLSIAHFPMTPPERKIGSRQPPFRRTMRKQINCFGPAGPPGPTASSYFGEGKTSELLRIAIE